MANTRGASGVGSMFLIGGAWSEALVPRHADLLGAEGIGGAAGARSWAAPPGRRWRAGGGRGGRRRVEDAPRTSGVVGDDRVDPLVRGRNHVAALVNGVGDYLA